MDELELLLDLLEVPSPSGAEERACALFADRAARFGLRVERDAVGNVIARAGGGRPHAMFLGHIDTVPGFWPVRTEDGSVSGRGAVDAKGALAAALAAVARIGDSAPGTRTVVAAVGEETDSRGALHLLQGPPPDAMIVGEPSSWDRVAIGFRGRGTGSFDATSVPGHASSPDPGALDRAVIAAARVQAFVASRAGPTLFDSPSCRLLRWTHTAATGEEIAAFDIDLRTPAGFDWSALIAAAPEILWSRPVEAVLVDKGNPAVRALVAGIRQAGGRPSYVRKGGSSDMNHAARVWRIPMASYGPGDPRLDHGPEERLAIAEYGRAIDVLEIAFLRLSLKSKREVSSAAAARLSSVGGPTGPSPSRGKGSGTWTTR